MFGTRLSERILWWKVFIKNSVCSCVLYTVLFISNISTINDSSATPILFTNKIKWSSNTKFGSLINVFHWKTKTSPTILRLFWNAYSLQHFGECLSSSVAMDIYRTCHLCRCDCNIIIKWDHNVNFLMHFVGLCLCPAACKADDITLVGKLLSSDVAEVFHQSLNVRHFFCKLIWTIVVLQKHTQHVKPPWQEEHLILSHGIGSFIQNNLYHWHRLVKNIGERQTKIWGAKGGNNWWKHRWYSIIGVTCPGCPQVYAYDLYIMLFHLPFHMFFWSTWGKILGGGSAIQLNLSVCIT